MNITAAHQQTLADYMADMLNGLYDDKTPTEVVIAVLDEFVQNIKEQS